MIKKMFYSNSGGAIGFSTLEDIKEYLGDSLDDFARIEEYKDLILAYYQNDYTPLCIGQIRYVNITP